MNIKKILSAVAVFVLAVSMCLGIAACGQDAKSMTGEEVTKIQWQKAFESLTADDVRITIEVQYEKTTEYEHETMIHETEWTMEQTASLTFVKNGSRESMIGCTEISYSGDKASAEYYNGQKAGAKDVEMYSEIKDGEIYNYTKNANDEWEKEETYASVVSALIRSIAYMADEYEYFEYSKEHKGYVEKGYEEGDELVVFKFKDGKLAAVYMYSEDFKEKDSAQEYECTTTTSEAHITITYSADAITLPKVGK